MQSTIRLLSIVILLALASCQSQKISKYCHEFSMDFSSANVQLRGELRSFGEYKGNLSNLTYEKYLALLKENERISTQGVAETVRESDLHFFRADTNTFFIVIYSKHLRAVICDNANTAFCDSIKFVKKKEPVPDLQGFIRVK